MSLLSWRRPVADEVRSELEFHIDMVIRELIANGATIEDARTEALRRFGDRNAVDRACRTLGLQRQVHVRRARTLEALSLDLRFALRQLFRNPGFSVVSILTLALAIGATTAIFGVVRTVVLRPFPWAHPERVMLAAEWWSQRAGSVSAGNYADWTAAKTFAAIGAQRPGNFNLADADSPERVFGGFVSAGYFDVFGTRPAIGRTFTAAEDVAGANRVVVLSHTLWSRRFAGDSTAVGRSMRINGRDHEIIGVMPAGYDPTSGAEQLWTPLAFTAPQLAMRDEHYLNVYALLKEGASPEQAQDELSVFMAQARERFPNENAGRDAWVRPLAGQIVGNLRGQLFVLLAAVTLVLCIACGNIANLLLARGAARAREIAVRAAIGAGRGRIVRQLMTESLVLAGVATALGIGIASLTLRGLIAIAPTGIPRLASATIDLPVLAFAVVLAVMSSLLFGVAPAWRIARLDLHDALKAGGRAGGVIRDRVRSTLIVGQVALALTLLVGAGLLIRTANYLQHVDPGYEPRGLQTARLTLPTSAYREPAHVLQTFEAVVRELRSTPGVIAAAAASQVPLGPGGSSNGLIVEGKPLTAASAVDARLRLVTPDYFSAMRVPVLAGRAFTDADGTGSPLVMMVSATLAKQFWPGQDPIGKRIICCEGSAEDPRWKTVVGIVADVRSSGPTVVPVAEFYLPASQAPAAAWDWIQRTMTLAVRADERTISSLPESMRKAVQRVDNTLPLYRMNSAESDLRASTAQSRFYTTLLTSLGALGLILSLVGIYGVIAYLVTLRAHELGVRMALGASSRNIAALITWQGLRLVLMGIALGVVASIGATRALTSVLFGVQPHDPATFVAVTLLLIIVGLAAMLAPAVRATKLDPTRVLQS